MTLLALAAAAAAPLENANAAVCDTFTTVNVIEVQPGMASAAREYYETGWAAAREVAVKRGVIAGYELMVSESGVSEHPEIVLITRYSNRAQFAQAEPQFQQIFSDLKLPRPLLIDGKTRAEILGPIEGADDYRTVFSSSGNCAVPGHG